MKCKNCIKWLFITESHNGVFGKCSKNKYWCNEDYECITKNKTNPTTTDRKRQI